VGELSIHYIAEYLGIAMAMNPESSLRFDQIIVENPESSKILLPLPPVGKGKVESAMECDMLVTAYALRGTQNTNTGGGGAAGTLTPWAQFRALDLAPNFGLRIAGFS
jgi:hypothetical protein